MPTACDEDFRRQCIRLLEEAATLYLGSCAQFNASDSLGLSSLSGEVTRSVIFSVVWSHIGLQGHFKSARDALADHLRLLHETDIRLLPMRHWLKHGQGLISPVKGLECLWQDTIRARTLTTILERIEALPQRVQEELRL